MREDSDALLLRDSDRMDSTVAVITLSMEKSTEDALAPLLISKNKRLENIVSVRSDSTYRDEAHTETSLSRMLTETKLAPFITHR